MIFFFLQGGADTQQEEKAEGGDKRLRGVGRVCNNCESFVFFRDEGAGARQGLSQGRCLNSSYEVVLPLFREEKGGAKQSLALGHSVPAQSSGVTHATNSVTVPLQMPLKSVSFLPSTSSATLSHAWAMAITSELVTHIHSYTPALFSGDLLQLHVTPCPSLA